MFAYKKFFLIMFMVLFAAYPSVSVAALGFQCADTYVDACKARGGTINPKTCICMELKDPLDVCDDIDTISACTANGGTYDYIECTCNCGQKLAAACNGTWDSTTCACTCDSSGATSCQVDGGTWDSTTCTCERKGCTYMERETCLNHGQEIDPETCECIEPDEPDLCEPLPNCSDIGFKYTASECGTLEKMKCPFDDRSYFCSANNSCPDGLFGSVEEAVAGCSDKYIWTAVAGNGVTMTKCYECCSGQMTAPGNSYNYDTKTGIDGKVCYYNIEAKPYVCDSICQCQNQCDAQYDDSCNRFGGSACEALAYCISQCK